MRSMLSGQRGLLLVGVLALASALLPAQAASVVSYLPRSIVGAVVGPPSRLLNFLSVSVRGRDRERTAWQEATNLEEEYGRAIRYINRLEDENAMLRDRVRQLTRVQEILGVRDARYVDAHVTSYRGGRVKPTLRIDRGANRGLRAGQVVVSGSNLVGVIESVAAVTAEVRLLTAAETGQLRVRLIPPVVGRPVRAVEAWVTLSDDGESFTFDASDEQGVKEGDLAHLTDDRWPPEGRGFIVGQVTAVTQDTANNFLFDRVTIKPIVPLESINMVTVLVPSE